MASSSTTRLIQAPVDAVWEVLVDFGEISRWGTGVDQSNLLTDGPVGLGTTRRVQVGRNTLRETITDWEPGVKLGYSLVGLPPVVRSASNTWELSAEGSSTKVTLTSEVHARGLIARIAVGKLGKAGVQLVDGLSKHLTGASA